MKDPDYLNEYSYTTEQDAINWMYDETKRIHELYDFDVIIKLKFEYTINLEWFETIWPTLEDYMEKEISISSTIYRELAHITPEMRDIRANRQYDYKIGDVILGILVYEAPTLLEALKTYYVDRNAFSVECLKRVIIIESNAK